MRIDLGLKSAQLGLGHRLLHLQGANLLPMFDNRNRKPAKHGKVFA
jgi:hypothetical protein